MADPKFTHYLFKPTGEVMPALKHPAGYEDAHPEDFEGAPAPEAAAAPPPPADLVPPAPPIPSIPPFAPPVTAVGNEDHQERDDTNSF